MSKILTIEEKQLADKVRAQKLAFISVFAKEPQAHDTLTVSGFLSCWNESLEAVGGPFATQGEKLLGTLVSKADFHGRNQWYYPAFPAFLFRVLYANFISDVSFSQLENWASLDFSEYSATNSGLEDWLEQCLGKRYDAEDYTFLGDLLSNHEGKETYLLKTAAKWAYNKAVIFKNELVLVQSGDEQEDWTRDDFTTRILPLLLCDPSLHFRILYKQAKARLVVEKRLYQNLFGINPGDWNAAEYLADNMEKLEEGRSWHYDFLAVKVAESAPEEWGWGMVCDHETGEILSDSPGDEADTFMSRLICLEERAVWHFLYHPNFFHVFIQKLNIIHERSLSSNTLILNKLGQWLDTNFNQYTELEDLEYFSNRLTDEINASLHSERLIFNRVKDWVNFRLALAKQGKLKKQEQQLSLQDKRLADNESLNKSGHSFRINLAEDFNSYRHAHLYSWFCSLPPAQADAALNDLIRQEGLWAPLVKSWFRIPLNPEDVEDRAFFLAEELSKISMFGIDIYNLTVLEKEKSIDDAWNEYFRKNDFNLPGKSKETDDFRTRLQEKDDFFGRQIPYHKCFPKWWLETIQSTPIYNLETLLSREIIRLQNLFTSHWNTELTKQDVQYLALILAEAAERETGSAAQRLSSAVVWLNNYGQKITVTTDRLLLPPAGYSTHKNDSTSATAMPSLFDKLCGGFSREQLSKVIGQDGLGLYDFNRKEQADTATSTDWALLYWGLQHKGFLPAGLSASKASELLKSTFGASISKTRINDTKPGLGEKPSGYLARVVRLLDTLQTNSDRFTG